MLTKPQRRALEILRNAEDQRLLPSQFAERMWPDSPYWKHSYNVGRGATRGIAMYRAGGAYLGRLQKLGYVHWTAWGRVDNEYLYHGYRLTDKGREALDAGG